MSLFTWVKRGLEHNICFSHAVLLGNLQTCVLAKRSMSVGFISTKCCKTSEVAVLIVWKILIILQKQ